jgi:hypothetical protein
VEIVAARSVADENVTLFVHDRPARDLMREIARLFGYKWRRTGAEPAYRYELLQELKDQLAEEELRERDFHQAFLALDEKMAGGQAERSYHGWGPAQMYQRLSPAQRLALASGQTLTFRSHGGPPDLRLPDDLRKRVIEETGFTLGTHQGAPAIIGPGFGERGTPLADLPGASATVTLSLNRSELGQLTLNGAIDAGLEDHPELPVMAIRGAPPLPQATSPSVARPENGKANAALRAEPEFRKVISLRLVPSCPRFLPGARPEDEGHYFLNHGDRKLFVGPGGRLEEVNQPHVTAADVWEALYHATGRPILADAYSRAYVAAPFTMEKVTLFDALCRAGDELGVRWQRDGDFLLARSTSFFWDRLKEVPACSLRRWQADRRRHGDLPLDDLSDMATCTDAQLDSKVVGYVIGHCWGLEDWGLLGETGAHGGSHGMVRYVRLLAGFTRPQLARAQEAGGLALAELAPAQQEALARPVLRQAKDPQALAVLRFHFDYAPAGSYLWKPVVNSEREADEAVKRWLVVVGRTPEATLALARRHNPSAAPAEIHRSHGLLSFRFQNARGDTWPVGELLVTFRPQP